MCTTVVNFSRQKDMHGAEDKAINVLYLVWTSVQHRGMKLTDMLTVRSQQSGINACW